MGGRVRPVCAPPSKGRRELVEGGPAPGCEAPWQRRHSERHGAAEIHSNHASTRSTLPTMRLRRLLALRQGDSGRESTPAESDQRGDGVLPFWLDQLPGPRYRRVVPRHPNRALVDVHRHYERHDKNRDHNNKPQAADCTPDGSPSQEKAGVSAGTRAVAPSTTPQRLKHAGQSGAPAATGVHRADVPCDLRDSTDDRRVDPPHVSGRLRP